MNRTYRIAALVISLALVATAAVVLRPEDATARADRSPSPAPAPAQEGGEEAGTANPADHGEGQTAQEAAQYASEQDIATQPPQWQAIYAHQNATRGPEQPIPFNHRFHSTDLQIDCMYCHVGTERSASGIVPSMDVCMGCHQLAGTGLPPIEQLRDMYANGQPVEWEWVNKLPEFVQFSHRPHLRNDITCQECHGPVEEMDRVYQWAPFTMGWCLECHRGQPLDTDVATDHLLSRSVEPIAGPSERQELSYYPRSIDSEYGKFRGPTDCAACHY